jgi:protein-S-isoprenylcysteine O-methyltransferase Ste14
MWIRAVSGVVLCLVGAVWIGQGINVIHGSSMSGTGRYAVLGAVLLVIGLGLLAWAWQARGKSRGGPTP